MFLPETYAASFWRFTEFFEFKMAFKLNVSISLENRYTDLSSALLTRTTRNKFDEFEVDADRFQAFLQSWLSGNWSS